MSSNEAGIVTYKIKMGDTLQRIALAIAGSADRWLDIASYNNLDAPYIVNFKSILGPQKATGIATFYTDSAPTYNITIPKNTIVATEKKEAFGTDGRILYQYQYITTAQIIIRPTSFTAVPVLVEAVESGVGYNIGAKKLSLVMDDALVALGVKVTNTAFFAGGSSKKVVSPGDIIFIPVGVTEDTLTFKTKIPVGNTIDDWADRALGQDFTLISEATKIQMLGQIANDIKVTSIGQVVTRAGVENLAQALTQRLTTERGELLYHPEYGSLLPSMIGSSSTPETRKLMAIEARNTLLADPRVVSVISVQVSKGDSGAYFVDSDVEVLGSSNPVRLNLVMPVAT